MSSAAHEGASTRDLVVVEPLAADRGGHPHQSLPLLAAAAARAGRTLVLVALRGVDPDIRAALEPLGALIVERPPRRASIATVLALTARGLAAAHRALGPGFPGRTLPRQLNLFATCLLEAASLRAGREALGRDGATTVVLTANVALHTAAAVLSRTPHVRYVHDLAQDEARAVRVVEWLTRRSLTRVWMLCTTRAITETLLRRYPGVGETVQAYTLADPAARLRLGEREVSRRRLGLSVGDGKVGSLVGGWWMVKDISTVVDALPQVREPFTLLVAGYRMDPAVLEQMGAHHQGELRVIDRQMTSEELRAVYAASDFTIISRSPVGKESGVALDAVSRGVPIVVSDHSGEFSEALRGHGWARVFDCGDPRALAQALDEACAPGLAQPPADAPSAIGMLEPDAMLHVFDRAGRCLHSVRWAW